jgi:integrase
MAHVEKRAAGRWRARYRGPDGRERSQTFDRKTDAERWLAEVETTKARGQWVDPALGRTTFRQWWEQWYPTTVDRRPTTRDLYEYLGRRYLLPTFGDAELAKITTIDVRRWLASMRATKLSPNTVAKGYRLLSRVLADAVESKLIGASPCTVKGAGTERAPEMRFATVSQLEDLVGRVDRRYRAMVILAAYGGLRWGELVGLRRRRVDLLHRSVRVAEQMTEVDGHHHGGRPKTEAGLRTVSLPAFVAAELEAHLERHAGPGPEDLVFPAPDGGLLRRSNFRRRTWVPATKAAGLAGLRFHDLRHSAATLSIASGADTRALMERMGWASPAAAIRYQHAMPGRDAAIAAALDELVDAARSVPAPDLPRPIRGLEAVSDGAAPALVVHELLGGRSTASDDALEEVPHLEQDGPEFVDVPGSPPEHSQARADGGGHHRKDLCGGSDHDSRLEPTPARYRSSSTRLTLRTRPTITTGTGNSPRATRS